MKKLTLRGIALNRSHLCGAVRRIMLLAEIAVMAVILVLVWDVFYNDAMPVPIFRRGYYPLAIFYGAVLFLCLKALKGRAIGEARLFDIIVSQILSLLLCNVVFYFPLSLLSYRILNPFCLIWMTVGQIGVTVLFCLGGNRLFFYLFRPLDVLLISDEPESTALHRKIDRFYDQFRISGCLSAAAERADMRQALKGCHAVLLETRNREVLEWITMQCFTKNIFLFMVPDIQDIVVNCARRFNLVDTPLLRTDSHRITTSDLVIKRAVDIVGSLLGLLVTLPLTLLAALCVALGDSGPVFFTQERLTRDGKPFRLIKFRTMVVNAERGGQRLASADDKRITPVGAVLRKTRLDELPQLWNVLRGDMSLVGPRPECPAIAAAYERELPDFSFRLKVKAGLTGMAQVYGNYDTSPRDKLLMDVMYIEDYTLALDIKLILLTLRTLFLTYKTRGVEAPEAQTPVARASRGETAGAGAPGQGESAAEKVPPATAEAPLTWEAPVPPAEASPVGDEPAPAQDEPPRSFEELILDAKAALAEDEPALPDPAEDPVRRAFFAALAAQERADARREIRSGGQLELREVARK